MTNRGILSRRATAWGKRLSLLLLFGISFASMASPRNYLRNPEFSDDGKEWRIMQTGDGAKIKVSAKPVGKAYEVDIAGMTRAGYIQLQQDAIDLPGNSECYLRFSVDAEHGSNVNWITVSGSNGQFLYHNSHVVKKGKNDFICRFFTPALAKEFRANMRLQIGGLQGKNVFSDLSITAVNESNELPYAVPESWNVAVGNESKQAAISGKPYNISAAFGSYQNTPAVFETTINSDREGFMEAGFSADYYMEVYLNDNLEYSTREKGNGGIDYSPNDHPLYLYLQKGPNKLRINVWPGTGGWRFVCGKPGKTVAFIPGKEYRAVDLTDLHIKADSALDLSALNKDQGGSRGRVVINKNGDFATESQPDIPLKLFGFNSSIAWEEVNYKTDDKTFQASIRRMIAAARRMGYNYIRLWLNEYVSRNDNPPYGVTPKSLERFDFLLHELEQNGIYVNLLITGPNLFGTAADFAADRARIHAGRMLMYLHDERVEKNWLYGLSLLNYVGPWSKKAIKDNPCIAEVECFNEQYAGLALQNQIRQTYPADYAKFQTAWNRFLSEKYAKIFTSEPIPESGAPYFNDYSLFCEKLVCDLNKWYVAQLRQCGYTGAIVQNDYKNLLFRSATWQSMPALDDHTYYAYPLSGINLNSRIDRESSLKNGLAYLRELASGRFDGRPFLVGEYNHCFWNPYQYECGAALGAFAAFQGFGGFNIHERPLVPNLNDLSGWKHLTVFTVAINPVVRGGEFLNAHLFLRGDVKPSRHLVSLIYPNKFLYSDGNAYKAPSTAQSMLALVSRYSLAFPELPVPPGVSRGRKPDLTLRPSGLAEIIDHEWFASVAETKDQDFSLSGAIAALRKKGILEPENHTDVERGVYQSDTGEITVRTKALQLIVNTPRTEVFVSPAGSREKINAFEVINSTANACVGMVSKDGSPLDESKHMVLVYTTRAANTEMRLSPNEKVLIARGNAPVLLQTGELSAELRNASDRLAMYALALNGERREKIPLAKRNGKWEIRIDTAKLEKEPAVFFEITAE